MTTPQFRQEALDQAQSEEHISDLIRVVSPLDWKILIAIGAFLAGLFLWAIFARIPTRVTGEGILIAMNGAIYDAVAPEGAARIVSVNVKLGDHVSRGQTVASLDNIDLLGKIKISERYVQELKNKYTALAEYSAKEIKNRKDNFEQQQNILQQAIKEETDHLAKIEDLLHRKQDLYKEGTVSLPEVMSTVNDQSAVKSKLQGAQSQSVQDHIALNAFIQDWDKRLRDMDLKMTDAEHEVAQLKEQSRLLKTVSSPVAGIITNIHVAIGDGVKEGTPIVSIADEGQGLDAIVFVPAKEGQRVRIGAEALVSPQTIEKSEFGSLVGKAIEVSAFPSTPKSMQALLHDEDLVKQFSHDSPPIALRIRISPNAKTYSGYQWTSGDGPERKIVPGMIVTAQITVREQAPIALLIPAFKHFVLGD